MEGMLLLLLLPVPVSVPVPAAIFIIFIVVLVQLNEPRQGGGADRCGCLAAAVFVVVSSTVRPHVLETTSAARGTAKWGLVDTTTAATVTDVDTVTPGITAVICGI